jgi:O-antigen/teichoic acid export membrane protein
VTSTHHSQPDADPVGVLDTRAAGPAVIRGGAIRALGFAFGVPVGILGAALLTRHLGSADYGRWSAVLSVTAIITGVAEAGMLNIGMREFAVRHGEDREAMFRNISGLRLTFACAGLLASVAFGVIAGYPRVMVEGLVLTGIGMLLTTAQSSWTIPLGTSLRYGRITLLDSLRQAGQTLLTAALVIAGASLLPFFVIPIPVGIVMLLATLPLVRRAVRLRPAFSWARWREILRLIAPYAAATAIASVYVYVATVLMSLTSPDSEVGFFSASFRVFLAIGGLATVTLGAAFPLVARTAEHDPERHAYAVRRLFDATLVIGLWAALMTLLCAPLAIDIIAGPQFHASIPVLRIQSLAVLGTFLTTSAAQVLVARKLNRVLVTLAVTGLLVSAALTLSLAPSIGAEAGAIANAAGELGGALLAIALIARNGRTWPVSLKELPKLALAAGLAAALALIPGIPQVVLGGGATLVFFGVLWFVHGIPQELLDAIPRPRRRAS